MLSIKAKRNRDSRRYITKLGSDQHPDLNSAGKSWDTAHLETQWGNGPRQRVTFMHETLKIAVLGSHL